jgi:4-amino-4-deoxy-L-arabinose transferase-like glycosyltransferase
MNIKKTIRILFLIFLLAGFLRFYKLGDIPSGFHRDEAFFGYNAYSILKTGKDMTGKLLPLHFESFLWSPGLYSYFSIPFIAIFGLSSFSTRFASALFGTLSIPLLYLFVLQLFQTNQKSFTSIIPIKIALLSSLLFAISPWHITLSRVATENTVVVFFLILGTILTLRWYRTKHTILLVLGYINFFITLYLYQAPRAFLPFLLPLLLILFWNNISKKEKIQYICLFLLFIVVPLYGIFSSHELSTRASTVGLFATEHTQLVIDESLREGGVQQSSLLIERLYHNKIIGYASEYIKNYISHFSYSFLFTDSGFPDRYRVINSGLLYFLDLPLILIGIYTLIKSKTKSAYIIFAWILISPLGSAYAFDDVPNLQRTLMMIPMLSILSAFGILTITNSLRKWKKLVYGILIILLGYSFSSYIHEYYVHMPIHRPWFRNEGYKELVTNVKQVESKYSKVIVTNRESAPAIFFLFYNAYDPKTYQEETKNPIHRSFDRLDFGNYSFALEDCPVREETKINPITGKNETVEFGKANILYVNGALCDKLPNNARMIKTIYRPDNTPIFHLVEILH